MLFVKPSTLVKQYESHIASLKEEIASLRSLVFPQKTSPNSIPLHFLEADAILSSKQEHIEATEEEIKKAEDEQSEAARIMSGNY